MASGENVYFIPRNNRIYNYIAHTNAKRRYIATLLFLFFMVVIGFYVIYKPLMAHIMFYKIELARLQKQHEQSKNLEKRNNDLLLLVDMHKKNITTHVIEENKREDECNKRTQFIFDLVTKLNLVLHSYGPCKEKDKKWYIKDSAAYQIVGPVDRILSFLKSIKDSNQMIIVSHLVVTHIKDNLYQLNCDIGLISIKK